MIMQLFIHYVIPLSGFAGKIIVVYEHEYNGESARGFDSVASAGARACGRRGLRFWRFMAALITWEIPHVLSPTMILLVIRFFSNVANIFVGFSII